MANTTTIFDETIALIVHWFTETYLNPDGNIVYALDGNTGQHLDQRNLLSELDDYVPFFWILGHYEYVLGQIQLLEQKMHKKPLLFSRPQIRKFRGMRLPSRFRTWLPHIDSQDYVEILFGLLELYELSQNRKFLDLAEQLIRRLYQAFYRNGMIRTWSIMPYGPSLPVADALSGMYIEIIADLARITKNPNYLEDAQKIGQSWTATPLFQEFHVFPSIQLASPWDKLSFFQPHVNRAALAKENTSIASGLLALASPPHSCKWAEVALHAWVQGLYDHFATPDLVLAHTPRLQKGDRFGPVLSNNFAVMDILCDFYLLSKSQASLHLAKSIADYFLEYQSGVSGLFPDQPGKLRSFIDANTDFAVSLKKLSEMTGESCYQHAGSKALQGILNYHKAPYGFYRDVHLETGKVINQLVETRYVSLLLKALILYRDNISIYFSEGQWSLFRDR